MTPAELSEKPQQRQKQRAHDLIWAIRWAGPTSGHELHAALIKTPEAERAEFLRQVQLGIESIGR